MSDVGVTECRLRYNQQWYDKRNEEEMNELWEGQVKDGVPIYSMVEWEDKDAMI